MLHTVVVILAHVVSVGLVVIPRLRSTTIWLIAIHGLVFDRYFARNFDIIHLGYNRFIRCQGSRRLLRLWQYLRRRCDLILRRCIIAIVTG